MTRSLRLLLLLVPVTLGLASAYVPGGAQTNPPGPSERFAFSDTTLLRDTLNLTFEGLFPLADSLGLTPDSLRALSIRYRMSLQRMTFLADSLRAPVDSVGVIMRRERFNPLSSSIQAVDELAYTSSYSIAQTTSSWTNGADWNFSRGPLFLRNTTNIVMDRFKAGGRLNLRQTRSALTEAGWKLTKDVSLGTRANLERFNSQNPGNFNNEAETKNEFQFSARGKHQPSRKLSTDLTFFSGLLDVRNSLQVKRGLSAQFSAKNRWALGDWFVHDVSGNMSGNLARTRAPDAVQELNSRDIASSFDGTLALFASSPAAFNVTYGLRRVRVETPLDSTHIQQIRTESDRLGAALRLRRDSDRYINLTEHLGRSTNASATNLSALNTRSDEGLSLQGRYQLSAWSIDASFDNSHDNSQFPRRSETGGYGGKTTTRAVQATIGRSFGTRLTLRADGRVSLSSSRSYIIGTYANPPIDQDQYRQSYKLDGQYNRSVKMSSGVSLEVIRQLYVNIPSASTGANNETRTYRAEWRWTYLLIPGLTVTQRNLLSADYVFYNFLPTNDRVSLSYDALTTLSAVVTPRTSIAITHDAKIEPGGNYQFASDGYQYLSKADEARNYTLSASFAYSPSSLLSLNAQTSYASNGRLTATEQGQVPQSDSRSLNVSGGATLNVPLGPKGRLSGALNRSYRADRSTPYQNGVAQPARPSEQDFWNGRLDLSWNP